MNKLTRPARASARCLAFLVLKNTMLSSRFIRTAIAHGYGLGVSVVGVVFTPWIFLAHLDSKVFGYWIVASSISFFFVISDGGISLTLGNYLALSSEKGSGGRGVVLSVVKKVIFRLAVVCFSLLFVLLGVYIVCLGGYLREDYVGLSVACFFLCVASGLQSVLNINEALFRSRDKNSKGIFLSNSVRFAEVVVAAVSVTNGGGLVVTAIAVFIAKALLSFYVLWVCLSAEGFSLHDIKYSYNGAGGLNRSGVGFASNFIATNLFLHGTPLVVSLMGASYAAALSTTRTMSRVPSMFSSIVFMAIGPEVSDAYRDRKFELLARVVKKLVLLSLLFTLTVEVVVYLNIDFLEQRWLHGKVAIERSVFVVLAACAVLNVVWQAGAQILLALNATYKVGVSYLILSIASTAVAFFCVINGLFGVLGVVSVTLIADVFMNYVVWRRVKDILYGDERGGR